MTKKLNIGVSACLLGQAVRYDGKNKKHSVVTDVLCQKFECIPICPEIGIGLGCPRPPIHLVDSPVGIRAVTQDKPALDITDRLIIYCAQLQIDCMSGYVLKSRSPSCGIQSTPLYQSDGSVIRMTNGLYADAIIRNFPSIPIIEDTALTDNSLLADFISRVGIFTPS